MPIFKAEAIIPKKLLLNPKLMADTIENALDLRAEDVRVDFEVTTYTWERKPTFIIATKKGERRIYTQNLIYKFISGGTRSNYPITPKRAKALRFYRVGFRPKTRVNYIGSNKGRKANQDLQIRKAVTHPGIKARNFDKVIAKKWKKQFPILLQRAINQAVNQP